MKIYKITALCLLFVSPLLKAQEQFYSTVDVTANVLEIASDKKLGATLNGGASIITGLRGSRASGSSWSTSSSGYYWEIFWVKLNKTVNCAGENISDFILLPVAVEAIESNYAASNPSTPWVAVPSPDDIYPSVKNLFYSAFTGGLQVKITRVICGNPQLHPIKNQLVPVAYIQGQRYFTVVPNLSGSTSNNSAWVNGVQVTPANAQPTNAVVTHWNFTIPNTGNYDVYVHWVSNKNQVANISYAVNGQALKSVVLDQNINAGIWTKLIKNTQYSAGEQSIKISVDANANYVVDGVRAEQTAQ